jgi:peptide chain release factor subunit 1
MVRIANRSSSDAATAARGARPALPPRSGDSGADPARLDPIVAWLTDLGVTGHWVVSCYLKLEPRDRQRGKYLIKLKNRIRGQVERLDPGRFSRAEREAIGRDLDRVRAYLEQPDHLPAGQGIAIFAAEGLKLFEAIPLPHVFRSRLAVDRSPLVREIAALDDEFGLVLCAAYDRASARLFAITAFGIREIGNVAPSDPTHAARFHGAPGIIAPGAGTAGEHNFNQRIREEKHRHYAIVAQRLFEAARGRPVRGIVLGGVGADVDAVVPHLHPYLARQILGSTRLNPRTVTAADVMSAVLRVRRESERAFEADYVRQLKEGLGAGWAVNGVEPVLRALARGQLRVLLVHPDAVRPGFRCVDTGRLTTAASECDDAGLAEPLSDVVDDAIEDALRQSCLVEVLEDQTARTYVDGLGGLLRFRAR